MHAHNRESYDWRDGLFQYRENFFPDLSARSQTGPVRAGAYQPM